MRPRSIPVVDESILIIVSLTDSSHVNQTPKKAVVAGVQFTRTKNGNLIRTGSVRAARSV